MHSFEPLKQEGRTTFDPLDERFARDAYSTLNAWEVIISDQSCEPRDIKLNLTPVDESVAELAGAMLESFADFLEAIAGEDSDSPEAHKADAREYREMPLACRASLNQSAS